MISDTIESLSQTKITFFDTCISSSEIWLSYHLSTLSNKLQLFLMRCMYTRRKQDYKKAKLEARCEAEMHHGIESSATAWNVKKAKFQGQQ